MQSNLADLGESEVLRRSQQLIAVALIVGSILQIGGPAEGESAAAARQRRDAVQRQRARLATQLDALRASDRDLENGLATLDREVARTRSKAEAARMAADSAQAAVVQAESRLAGAKSEVETARRAAVGRAVSAYVRPLDDGLSAVLNARDLDDVARRQSLLAVVGARATNILDQLQAAEEDLAIAKADAAEASRLAAERRDATMSELDRASQAQAAQARLRDALDRRIAAFVAESDALGKEAASLSALIRSRERPPRASRGGGDNGAASGPASAAGLIWPLRGPVTSEYGPRWGRMHEGMDISASSGTPIRAAKGGEVIFVGQQGGYGNMTLIDHGGGFVTAYPHQSRFGTTEGASVAQGQVIGFVGCTGSCTGPHLHFETRVNGAAQNPRRYLP